MTILRTQGNKYQEQADILDRKYSIAKNEFGFLPAALNQPLHSILKNRRL